MSAPSLPPLVKTELTVGRFRVPVAVAGGGAHCLVCVNGMQQTMASWRPFLRSFGCNTNYRTVVFDFPTQGRARIEHGPPETTLAEQVDVVRAVARFASPHQPVALFGGSWGAVIAALFAATEPSHVGALLLASFSTSPTTALRDVTRRGQALIAAGDGDALGALFVEGFGAGMRPAGQERLREQFSRLTGEQLRQMHFAGETFLAYDDLGALADLRRISARTLILIGGQDPLVDATNAAAAAARIPRGELRVVPDAGHFLHIENPDLLQTYQAFFDDALGVPSAGREAMAL